MNTDEHGSDAGERVSVPAGAMQPSGRNSAWFEFWHGMTFVWLIATFVLPLVFAGNLFTDWTKGRPVQVARVLIFAGIGTGVCIFLTILSGRIAGRIHKKRWGH